jgi:hypothetical protein
LMLTISNHLIGTDICIGLTARTFSKCKGVNTEKPKNKVLN